MRLGLCFALLASAVVASGCSDDGLAQSSSTAAAETSSTGGTPPATTSGEGDTADPPAGSSSGSTTGGPGTSTGADPSTGTGESTGTRTGSESSGDSGSTGDQPNQACADGCAVEFSCGTDWMSEQECVDWCEANLEKADAFSPFCRAAWEMVSACLGTLTCEEFEAWENPTEFPYPCSDADVVLSVECKGQ